MPHSARKPSPRSRRTVLAAAAAAAALVSFMSSRASAQGSAPAFAPGTRVRLIVPCDAAPSPDSGAAGRVCRLEGRFVRAVDGVITLAATDSAVSRDLSGVRRIEVSRNRRSHWLVGAGVGFLVGAGVTYAVVNTGGSTALCNRDANQDAIGSAECLGLTALGGVAGAGLGALVGSLIRTERWEEVPLDRLRVGLWTPSGTGAGLAVAFVF